MKIAIDELKKNGFKDWFEVRDKWGYRIMHSPIDTRAWVAYEDNYSFWVCVASNTVIFNIMKTR